MKSVESANRSTDPFGSTSVHKELPRLAEHEATTLMVIWNVASGPCKKWKKVDMHLHQFNITHNKGEEIFGEKVVIFYEKKFGLCPYYKDYKSNQPVNGGLPQ
ncbi:hypothetical protein TELCIR_15292, partial [Teladorsagia circumcincta]